ncbi:polysaccharide deacetylase family protein [Arthrobacter sp. TMT4-20]
MSGSIIARWRAGAAAAKRSVIVGGLVSGLVLTGVVPTGTAVGAPAYTAPGMTVEESPAALPAQTLPSNPSIGFSSPYRIGHGWTASRTISVGDWDGNGFSDLMLIASDGRLLYYAANARERFASPRQIGNGWLVAESVQGGVDWNRDGALDLIARFKDGRLMLYPGNGSGGFLAARQIGHGWLTMRTWTPVQQSVNGYPAVVATDKAGFMHVYPTNGTGSFLPRIRLGGGWLPMRQVVGAGDWDKNGRSDLLVVDSEARLRLYAASSSGTSFPMTQIGTGWSAFPKIFATQLDPRAQTIWAVRTDGALYAYPAKYRGPNAAFVPWPSVPTRWDDTDWESFPTTRPVVALTFDGGASNAGVTSILNTLDRYDATASFFVTGQFARAYPASVRAMAADGYPVGNHSNTHPYFSQLTNEAIRLELARAEAAIWPLTGKTTMPYFRFPYGDRTQLDIDVVNGFGYVPFRWTVDTLGWRGTSGGITASIVCQRVLNTARPGQIVLMHVGSNPNDGTALDAAALPCIIEGLRARGYGFVTVEALLD